MPDLSPMRRKWSLVLARAFLSLIIPNNSDAGYQVDMLITGDDKDGKVIHDAGHTSVQCREYL